MQRELKKIVLIGPVFPFKGGISHYTGCLVRSLKKDFNVETISFKLQYPKFLFKKEQRDYSNDTLAVNDTKFWINTVNPFNWILVAKKIKKLKPNYILIEWWHPYFTPCFYFLLKLLHRFPVIILCHNVLPHERFPLDKFLTKLVLNCGNFFITHSKSDSESLCEVLKNPKYITTVHPTYNMFNISNLTKTEARSLLKIDSDENVLLFFGFVREYKGLMFLIEALPNVCKQYPNTTLYVVGDFDKDKCRYLDKISELKLENYIRIVDGYIPDKEVEKYFAASDLVVLPYISATQSGIAQIAYGFEKPVVATNVGGLPDVVEDGKTGYLVPPQAPETLADAIMKFFDSREKIDFKVNIKDINYKYDWMRMNEAIKKLIDE